MLVINLGATTAALARFGRSGDEGQAVSCHGCAPGHAALQTCAHNYHDADLVTGFAPEIEWFLYDLRQACAPVVVRSPHANTRPTITDNNSSGGIPQLLQSVPLDRPAHKLASGFMQCIQHTV